MDLSAQASIKILWAIDPLTNIVTLTYKTSLNVVLGTMIIEGSKFRSFIDAHSEIGLALFPSPLDLVDRIEQRTIFNESTMTSETVFE